jgi:hypothetical protein
MMNQNIQQLTPVLLLLLFVCSSLGMFVFIAIRLWKLKTSDPLFPARDEVNIVFEERWTSGNSNKTKVTQWGGASNCLLVIVTDEELWVTTHFPFNAM